MESEHNFYWPLRYICICIYIYISSFLVHHVSTDVMYNPVTIDRIGGGGRQMISAPPPWTETWIDSTTLSPFICSLSPTLVPPLPPPPRFPLPLKYRQGLQTNAQPIQPGINSDKRRLTLNLTEFFTIIREVIRV